MTAMPQPGVFPMKRTSVVNLRMASFDDYEPVARLATRYKLHFESYEAWRHLWVNNPAYQAVRESWPTGWVLENSQRDIVGYVGNLPLQCEFRGQPLLAATSRAWVVDTAHRGYALLLLDCQFSDKRIDLFLHPTTGPEAIDAYNAMNTHRVPVGQWDQSAFWITGYRNFARSALTAKNTPMAGALSVAVAAGLRMKDIVAGKRRLSVDETSLELCERFDERFDIFWEELRKRNSHRLLSVRSREALQWHFEYALREERAWVLVAADGGRIHAYSIFFRSDNPYFGLRRMRLVDYQSLDGGTAALLPMLNWALKRCREQRIDMLENVGLQPAIVRELAHYRRKLSNWFYYYKANSAVLAEALKDPSVWAPSGFDGDASL